jgi:hypothetical protein
MPVNLAGVAALHWRVGRRSVVSNVNFERTLWDPDSPGVFHPCIRIAGQGGGRWYQLQQTQWWSQSWHYRHLLVDHTTEPLHFYQLNPEHARCEAQVEFRSARHVAIYACKGEGNYPVLWFNDCADVRCFGYGGNGAAWPGWPLIRITGGQRLLLTQVAPQTAPYAPGRWTALAIRVGDQGWWSIDDNGHTRPPDVPLTWYELT